MAESDKSTTDETLNDEFEEESEEESEEEFEEESDATDATDAEPEGSTESEPTRSDDDPGREEEPREKTEREADVRTDKTEYTTLRGRIAAGLRESSPLGRIRDFIFPLLTVAVLIFLLLSFRTVLLPFIFACALVYLMEPIVKRLGGGPDREGYVPRWMAVIFVYLVFIGGVALFSALVVPRFVTEIIRFAETVPEIVQDFREEQLPDIDAQVQEFLRSYVPARPGVVDYAGAQEIVHEARRDGARKATALAAATRIVDHAASTRVVWRIDETMDQKEPQVGRYEVLPPEGEPNVLSLEQALATNSGWEYESNTDSSIKLVPTVDGGVEVFLQGMAVQVERTDENIWTVRQDRIDEIPLDNTAMAIEENFNLQRTLDEIIQNLVTTSNARISSAIDVAQKLVLGVVGGFVAIILTLMVAAFISIDLPRVMSFLRSLVPERGLHGYDILIERLDRGLAGVVRGQLMICLVNGIFTYIGLAILGVKFSVLLAVVAGVLSLIPVFGTIISTIPIVIIGLTDGLMTGLLALGWILLIHFVEANILNPKIIGSSAHIHPVIVIFALLAGESAFGLVGALLAVPTASILLTLFEFVRSRAWREGDSEVEAEPA